MGGRRDFWGRGALPPFRRVTTGWLASWELPLSNYAGNSFEIVQHTDQVMSLTVPVEAYDDVDADFQFKRMINKQGNRFDVKE